MEGKWSSSSMWVKTELVYDDDFLGVGSWEGTFESGKIQQGIRAGEWDKNACLNCRGIRLEISQRKLYGGMLIERVIKWPKLGVGEE